MLKLHGWVGGVSSIAVIAVGLALFVICRKYVKWRITLAYLAATALFALGLNFVYGGDPILRVVYRLFVGSSIFLAFFMATDPATTPLTHWGQAIFGVGLGILSIVFQVYFNFLGGSIAALVIMNLTSPLLDKVGIPPSRTTKITPKLQANLCEGCGHCVFVCPARIDLKGTVLRSKAMLRQQ